jgi:hypothetical protein
VDVAEGVARHACPLVAFRLAEDPLGVIAIQSKYAHQSAHAITIPSAAAAIRPISSPRPAAPTPIATIDSPRAMMMISAKRSMKWLAEMWKPLTPKTSGPP